MLWDMRAAVEIAELEFIKLNRCLDEVSGKERFDVRLK